MIGGMRSAAQLMSYEIPLLLSMAGVFLLAGSFDPVTIVEQQRESTWLFGYQCGMLFLSLSVLLFSWYVF
jgi:NADH-quinone oxidoreductase subunit H